MAQVTERDSSPQNSEVWLELLSLRSPSYPEAHDSMQLTLRHRWEIVSPTLKGLVTASTPVPSQPAPWPVATPTWKATEISG
jgi:hypothetical protein